MRKDLEILSKGTKSDSLQKAKRWTRHQKWKLTKFGHGDKIKEHKEEMILTIKKFFETVDMLLDETLMHCGIKYS